MEYQDQNIQSYLYCSIYIDFPRKGANELRTAQIEDPEIKHIIDSFESNNENFQFYTNRGYIMLDEVC